MPSGGVTAPLTTPTQVEAARLRLAAGTGPVAVDAERASGYRYGQRAYLVQLRRRGAGTVLLDPVGVPDLSALGASLAEPEWVLHAANQDLPCLAELGLVPGTLFDTELAGRLAGFERVGLGAIVERMLGVTLQKGHAAVDWSTRPLPHDWLVYAALDVELLVDLRDALAEELERQGKLDWAHEEFAAVLATPTPPPRAEPWRRTSGIHAARGRRQLAVVRSLWTTRDDIARERDLAPGRVLPDSAIVAAARANPRTPQELTALPVFSGRANRRLLRRWFAAVEAGRNLDDADLPSAQVAGDGPPPTNRWPDRDPEAAARLAAIRTALAELAERVRVPVENLLAPDLVRRYAWAPPATGAAEVGDWLRGEGARAWQVELTAPVLAAGSAGSAGAAGAAGSAGATAAT